MANGLGCVAHLGSCGSGLHCMLGESATPSFSASAMKLQPTALCYMISYDFKIPDGQGQGLIDVNVESLQQFFGTGVHIACVDERNTSISNLPNPIYRDKIFSNCYGPAFPDIHLPSPPSFKISMHGCQILQTMFQMTK